MRLGLGWVVVVVVVVVSEVELGADVGHLGRVCVLQSEARDKQRLDRTRRSERKEREREKKNILNAAVFQGKPFRRDPLRGTSPAGYVCVLP